MLGCNYCADSNQISPQNVSLSNYIFPPAMGTQGLFVYFMQGFLCVSVCFPCSYWLDQSQSVWLAKSYDLSRGRACRQMNTHANTYTHAHTHGPVSRQPNRNQVIEQSLYPSIPDITEKQKICTKRDSLPSSLRLCLSLHVSLIDPDSGVDLDCLPTIQWAYKWIHHHSHLFIPSILLGMSPAQLCNEHVHSRVLF